MPIADIFLRPKMSLTDRYNKLVDDGAIKDDVQQRAAIISLNLVSSELTENNLQRTLKKYFWKALWQRNRVKVKGLYIFGGVGTGKSMLMDLFFMHTNIQKKRRVHFHAFMQEIHKKITLERSKETGDPIKMVSHEIAQEVELLCFDEIQIIDITDAMIVGRLFEQLFIQGVTLVTTSNVLPDDLYKDGLNRHLFLPFIELIKKEVNLFQVDVGIDYRQGRILGRDRYLNCNSNNTSENFEAIWHEFVSDQEERLIINIGNRELIIPRFFHGVGRIPFDDLCGQALGAIDYLTLCKHVKVLFIENIPVFDANKLDLARRFIVLIDTIYEARITLICTALAEPDDLYKAKRGAFEFQRTASRLFEMRSDLWPE